MVDNRPELQMKTKFSGKASSLNITVDSESYQLLKNENKIGNPYSPINKLKSLVWFELFVYCATELSLKDQQRVITLTKMITMTIANFITVVFALKDLSFKMSNLLLIIIQVRLNE